MNPESQSQPAPHPQVVTALAGGGPPTLGPNPGADLLSQEVNAQALSPTPSVDLLSQEVKAQTLGPTPGADLLSQEAKAQTLGPTQARTCSHRKRMRPEAWRPVQETPRHKAPVTYELREASDHLSLLQVGLPVQVGRLDVAQPIGVAGGQQQDVCGDGLIAAEAHEVSHADLFPEPVHVLLLLPGKDMAVNKAGGAQLRPHLGGGHTQLGEHSAPPSGMWKISVIKSAEDPLLAQVRIRLPMQATRVQSLVQEDSTCHGAT